MTSRTLLLASALLLTASPAFAWEYEAEKLDNGHMYLSTWQGADATDYSLQLECEETFSDDPDVILFTPEAFDDKASYPSTVPLTVTVDGSKVGPLNAVYENVEGKIAVIAYQSDDDRVTELFDTLRHATGSIKVTIPFGEEQSFDVKDAAGSISQFQKECDDLNK